jgi:hypothetical protein
MQVTSATFTVPPAGVNPIWVLRLEVEGSGFVQRAAPVVAQVGAVPVECIVLNLGGSGFIGLLRNLPQAADPLKVGYLDTQLSDTGLTYQPPVAV